MNRRWYRHLIGDEGGPHRLHVGLWESPRIRKWGELRRPWEATKELAGIYVSFRLRSRYRRFTWWRR